MRDNPVFTVADGLFWLSQNVERNSVVRKLQIMKLRGQDSVPGLHTIRITEDGLQAFSRTMGLSGRKQKPARRAAAFHRYSRAGQDDGRRASSKAIACSWPALRARANRRWPHNSSPQVCARENRASRRSSKNARKAIRRGPPAFGLDLKTPQEKGTSKFSTSVRSTFRWTKRCRRFWTRCRGPTPSGW